MIKTNQPLHLVFLGPPGSGKGTLSHRINEKMHLTHLSTGDLFREAIAKSTRIGKIAKELMEKGQYVPDNITNDLVKETINKLKTDVGFILDGYPRTLNQAEFLNSVTKITHVILLDVKNETLLKRLTGRRICSNCKTIYNIYYKPTTIENICNKCGAKLTQRKDDELETAKKRISVYEKETKPLIDYYKKLNLLHVIDGSNDGEDVFNKFLQVIK